MQKIENAIERAIKFRANGIFVSETFDLARKQATKAIENGLKPFPIVVKDCFLTKDAPTTCASQMLANYIPPTTSTVVDRIVRKGGCIIGKTNMDEFCMGTSSQLGHFGPVKSNIRSEGGIEEDWMIPGGSSGGSAVAVQTGIADVALGSDTGGSTRNPAAFNGIFGLKPTYGVLSRQGLIPLVNSLDAPSIFARSAEECWDFLDKTRGLDDNDSTSIDLPESENLDSLKNLRVGVPIEYHNEKLSENAWKIWNHAINVLKNEGAEIFEISLPHTKYSLSCYSVIAAADVASNMARYDSVAYGHRSSNNSSTHEMYAESRSESLNTVVRRRILAGNYFLMKKYRSKYYEKALKIRRLINDEIINSFNNLDVIITPTASGKPPKYSELRDTLYSKEDDDDYFTQAANLAGIPSISVPSTQNENRENYPIAVQIMGNRLNDRLVCDVARMIHTKF
ncbi:unnamed protein product [Caenorhabditis angaria]|uniref:Glutamyl-tRNA(Gln) amidotransferase subunit A, mitochondrial n=1 Tax=Caenorhabditis angaria TaxID=860376 RepID=A0A9P1IM35_9PELO|nr:unnamed protein product [Caenorhabditis angaria]